MLFQRSRYRSPRWISCFRCRAKPDRKKTGKKRFRRTLIVIFLLFIFGCLLNHIHFWLTHPYQDYLSDSPAVEKTLKRLSKSTLLRINGRIKHLGAAKQIYIINLCHRTDRRTSSIALFQTLHLDAFIAPAYTIHSPDIISRFHLLHNGHITLVELACWASHMQIWLEVAMSKNDTWAFVFEDDIDLEMSTFNVLESLPHDIWNIPDMIYLGHCGDPSGPIIYEGIQGYRVHRAIYPSCTHAYAIRSRAASKLIHLLSSPRRAIDDEIVRLVGDEQILVYSIHPPLAVQQLVNSLHPSDVNPVKNTLVLQIKTWVSFIRQWWRGVQFIGKLKDSALDHADFNKANKWRRYHENGIWKSANKSFRPFSRVK